MKFHVVFKNRWTGEIIEKDYEYDCPEWAISSIQEVAINLDYEIISIKPEGIKMNEEIEPEECETCGAVVIPKDGICPCCNEFIDMVNPCNPESGEHQKEREGLKFSDEELHWMVELVKEDLAKNRGKYTGERFVLNAKDIDYLISRIEIFLARKKAVRKQ